MSWRLVAQTTSFSTHIAYRTLTVARCGPHPPCSGQRRWDRCGARQVLV